MHYKNKKEVEKGLEVSEKSTARIKFSYLLNTDGFSLVPDFP